MKILFVSRKYANISGGVERMSIAIMNEMAKRGHDVHLLSWDDDGATTFYPIDRAISWHKLALGNPDYKASLLMKIRRAQKTRKIVAKIKPDIAIAFQDGAFRSTRIYTMGMGLPVIAAERNAPTRFDHTSDGRRKNIIFQSLRLAKKVTVQFESYRKEYPLYLQKKIVTIPNPVKPSQNFATPSGQESKEKILLSIGRLEYQKNFSVLLEAFKDLQIKFPGWKLIIQGEGSERKNLEKFIKGNGLDGCIQLLGKTGDVESYLCKSHLFCLPSRWEGFPNALAEAMAHGLPSVGFAECAGVGDLIQNGESGILAAGNGDAASLSKALQTLMVDHALRGRMGAAARKLTEKYKPEFIFDQWEKLFKEAAQI